MMEFVTVLVKLLLLVIIMIIINLAVLKLKAKKRKCWKSFILRLWSKVFDGLGWVSPFRLVCVLVPRTKGSYGFVDAWVLGNLAVSVLCWWVLSIPQFCWWKMILILSYPGIRVFEIVIYQINVLLFNEWREGRKLRSYPEWRARRARPYPWLDVRRLVLLVLHNYIEILFWFALFYRNFACLFHSEHIRLDSLMGSLYFSVVTMSTLGYGDIVPKDTFWGLFLIVIQTSIGIFIALLMLARFISLVRRR